jgi:hypothetical protein
MNEIRIKEVDLRERDVRLRLPFRFGVVTLREAPQLFCRVRIELPDGRGGWGSTAELLAPKWFDKDPSLSNDDNFEQLRNSVRNAAALYLENRDFLTPFGHFSKHHSDQLLRCAVDGLNPLVSSFGSALIDRAILDALCRVNETSFFQAVRSNLCGIGDSSLLPDLRGFQWEAYLESLSEMAVVHARHTVGLADPIEPGERDEGERVNDGLPETLTEVIAEYGHSYFKIKVSGDADADLERLRKIAAVMSGLGDYRCTLDGNEQFEEVEQVEGFWNAMLQYPDLQKLAASILFIEQPLPRKVALEKNVESLARLRPVIIDESDQDLDAFPLAVRRGYCGVSSKNCKGMYKSLINLARCRKLNEEHGSERFFMSAEDLTNQAGLAVQQDLALAALLGLKHIERNGHHYVRGMDGLPAQEQEAFLAAHPDLYLNDRGFTRLRIAGGKIRLSSLDCPGFASGALPQWNTMREVRLQK